MHTLENRTMSHQRALPYLLHNIPQHWSESYCNLQCQLRDNNLEYFVNNGWLRSYLSQQCIMEDDPILYNYFEYCNDTTLKAHHFT